MSLCQPVVSEMFFTKLRSVTLLFFTGVNLHRATLHLTQRNPVPHSAQPCTSRRATLHLAQSRARGGGFAEPLRSARVKWTRKKGSRFHFPTLLSQTCPQITAMMLDCASSVILTMFAPGWSDTCVFSAFLLCELQSSTF